MQLSIKKLRLILSFALLIEVRSITPKIIKIYGLLLKPVPSFLKSVHGWMPATAGMVTTHALSGATTEVKSYQGNSLNVKTGEDVSFRFYTSRYTAGSYRVSGLPNGLSYDGRNTISGSISEAGNYSVNIVGYRGYSQNGSSTPTFLLSVDASDLVLPMDSDGDGVDDTIDKFPDDPKRASGSDFDSDGTDDESDNDRDGDEVDNASDEFPDDPNRTTTNTNTDGVDSGDVYNNEILINNFSSISNLSDNWFDTWLGIFYIANEKNWVFHFHLGWLYIHPIEKDAFWVFDYNQGWLYTSKSLYPFFYRISSAGWLYHLANSNKNRFWDYSQEIELE